MRYLLIVLLLAGCATPLTPDQRAQRLADETNKLIAKFGPACERIGLAPASDSWANCVVKLSQEEEAENAASRAAWANALKSYGDAVYGPAAQQRRQIPVHKQIDYECLNACTANGSGYSYGLCQSKCSY